MSLSFTYLLLRSIYGTGKSSYHGDVTAVFVNNHHGIQRRGQDFDKKFGLGYTTKRLTDEFPEKSWTKCGVKLLTS